MNGEEGTHMQTCHHAGANHSDGLARNLKSSNWSYSYGVVFLSYFVLFSRALKKKPTKTGHEVWKKIIMIKKYKIKWMKIIWWCPPFSNPTGVTSAGLCAAQCWCHQDWQVLWQKISMNCWLSLICWMHRIFYSKYYLVYKGLWKSIYSYPPLTRSPCPPFCTALPKKRYNEIKNLKKDMTVAYMMDDQILSPTTWQFNSLFPWEIQNCNLPLEILNSYRWIFWAFPVILPSGECYRTSQIGSGNHSYGSLTSDNKALPEPVLIEIYVTTMHH